jgi:bacteriocin-like protein
MSEFQAVSESELQSVEGGAYHPLTLLMLVGPAGLGAGVAWYLLP